MVPWTLYRSLFDPCHLSEHTHADTHRGLLSGDSYSVPWLRVLIGFYPLPFAPGSGQGHVFCGFLCIDKSLCLEQVPWDLISVYSPSALSGECSGFRGRKTIWAIRSCQCHPLSAGTLCFFWAGILNPIIYSLSTSRVTGAGGHKPDIPQMTQWVKHEPVRTLLVLAECVFMSLSLKWGPCSSDVFGAYIDGLPCTRLWATDLLDITSSHSQKPREASIISWGLQTRKLRLQEVN